MSKIYYGSAGSPFGFCSIAFEGSNIYSMIFPDNEQVALVDFSKRLKTKDFEKDNVRATQLIHAVFEENMHPELKLKGTVFQQAVWKALQEIPVGKTSTYAEIARKIGHPKAVRAVGTAIGANPVAYLIPCHRVLRTDGGLGGFRWGLEIKKKMLRAEGVIC